MTEISPTAQASRFGEHARQLVGRTLFCFFNYFEDSSRHVYNATVPTTCLPHAGFAGAWTPAHCWYSTPSLQHCRRTALLHGHVVRPCTHVHAVQRTWACVFCVIMSWRADGAVRGVPAGTRATSRSTSRVSHGLHLQSLWRIPTAAVG